MDNNASVKKFIVLPQVQEHSTILGQPHLALRTIWTISQRIRLGGNRVAWLQSEVNSWIESKLASRRRRNTN